MGRNGLDLLNALLVPRGAFAWLTRLLGISTFSFLCHILLQSLLGLPMHPLEDFIALSATIVPLMSAVMLAARIQKRDIATLAHEASTDNLTGLMNRPAFMKNVGQADAGVLLIVDLDHFKDINDRYGHAVGDAVLCAVADQLRLNTRKEDFLARIGGEEFGIFLVGMDSLEVDRVGERLCRGFVLCNDEVRIPVKVTMSAGAAFSGMARTWAELFTNADQALYRAKRSGRAQLAFWQPAVTSRY